MPRPGRGARPRRGAGGGPARAPRARGDAGRLLLPRPPVALHPRQCRGRAPAGPRPRRAARPGAAAGAPGPRRQRARQCRFAHVKAEPERLLGRDRDELLGQELWTAFPGTVGSAFEQNYRTAVRTGTPVQFDAHYPAPLDGWYELRAWPSPEGLSVYFLEVTERRRVQDRAERGAQRLALLAQVSAELAGALDAHTATAHLPRLVVPALADWCVVTVVDPDGRPRDVGHWHVDPPARPPPAGS